jgi:hypothetical protein
MRTSPKPVELFIATNGNDNWSGRLAAPNRDKTDGPLATLNGARLRLRELQGLGGKSKSPETAAPSEPLTVWVRGGRYELRAPVVFEPADSYPVTFAAYRREKPVFDGGTRIGGWKATTVNGRAAWVAELPAVAAGTWAFRELYVNGRRAVRPRWPASGLFRMESVPGMPLPAGWGGGGQTRFVAAPKEVRGFRNLPDVEVVYVHFWIEERSPLAGVDLKTREVAMTRTSRTALVGSPGSQLADYYYDNVFEELREPGQWYLDRSAGKLYYLPRPGETPENTEITAPRCLQLLAFLGKPEESRYVEFVRLRGLTFRHTDWRHPSHDGANVLGACDPDSKGPSFSRRSSRGNAAAAGQAACDVPGIIAFEGARNCALEDCTVECGGWYGVEIGDGCRNLRIVGNTIRELGAGGVRINGAAALDRMPARETGLCRITDNEMTALGRVFHSAVGVLSMHAYGMVIAHNHIHDLYYSGVSCGWVWGYGENVSRDNRIEKNHIHDIGHGLLSDMGGIYTLGVQPGTMIRGNLIHGIRSAHYGGWCIYPDEGTSHVLIEGNVCYDADRQPFHQHYGRENVVRNNIFAFGGESVAHYSRADQHNGITFTQNLLITDGKPVYTAGYQHQAVNSHKLADRRFRSDLNLLFDVGAKPLTFQEQRASALSLEQWRALGQDTHSVVADPRFRDWKGRDFRLRPGSPALALGFEAPDVADVGPRPRAKRD